MGRLPLSKDGIRNDYSEWRITSVMFRVGQVRNKKVKEDLKMPLKLQSYGKCWCYKI